MSCHGWVRGVAFLCLPLWQERFGPSSFLQVDADHSTHVPSLTHADPPEAPPGSLEFT